MVFVEHSCVMNILLALFPLTYQLELPTCNALNQYKKLINTKGDKVAQIHLILCTGP